MIILTGVLAFFCQYVDSSLGMGYGTTFTPLLLLLGYPPMVVIPVSLLSQFVAGTTAGAFHHQFGNISLRTGSRDLGIIGILTLTGIAGTIVAVLTAINISGVALKGYIGAMVFLVGLSVFIFRKYSMRFSWLRIAVLGVLSAFNKGMSGGGYGPLLVSGQLLSGYKARNAIGTVASAEGLICAVGFSLYLILHGGPGWFGEHWEFALPIVIGATLAAPASAWTTKTIAKHLNLKLVIAFATCILGAWTLFDTFA